MKIILNKNTHWKVKNLRGFIGLKCSCGSWWAQYRKHTHSNRNLCAVLGCNRMAEPRAHAQLKDMQSDSYWWIAPLQNT